MSFLKEALKQTFTRGYWLVVLCLLLFSIIQIPFFVGVPFMYWWLGNAFIGFVVLWPPFGMVEKADAWIDRRYGKND